MVHVWKMFNRSALLLVMAMAGLTACVSTPPGARPEPTVVPQPQPAILDEEQEDEDGVG